MRILITAGNTREMIDPVRYLSNVSTGVMGYSLADTARKMGFHTTLISGPTALKPPKGVKLISIVSSHDLQTALSKHFPQCDVLFMTSAVCDFRPARLSRLKIKRKDSFSLKLIKTPDILKGLSRIKGKKIVVGFCLETDHLIQNARRKLQNKKLDFIVANFLGRGSQPFGPHRTSVTLISKEGRTISLKNAWKPEVARFLLKEILVRNLTAR